ncbi:hypothetical protein [Rhodococcoides corynebacterioides]|uniref:RES domain-containing protein n=1 Tax=Rhodococcoides corynebacterioides TaxID=53972 RepID=A0ABS7P5U9_9NOCA|nr:hypothetical protein [Rhodococcus corynebacterioides]MBY6367700.1 hypothetical protein [Rhodococcus corynebacterioides]MBY6407966.1 hypothetical protein [Rhodococcus corynebacterioides]
MLLDPEYSLPPLEAGQRLFICAGSPWDEALADLRNPRADQAPKVWNVARDYAKGDWILTYLSTQPRVFLCWEQAVRDATPGGQILVDYDRAVYFENLVVVDTVERRTGLTITSQRSFEYEDALSIRDALINELWYPRSWHGLPGRHGDVNY